MAKPKYAFYAVPGPDGEPRAAHMVVGLQPEDAVEISEAEARQISAGFRRCAPRDETEPVEIRGITRDDIRAEAMALLNDIFELKGENMKAEDFKQLDEAQKKEALAAELAALKTKMPPPQDLGPINATLEELKAAIGVLAGDFQNTSARVGAIEEAILSAGGK